MSPTTPSDPRPSERRTRTALGVLSVAAAVALLPLIVMAGYLVTIRRTGALKRL